MAIPRGLVYRCHEFGLNVRFVRHQLNSRHGAQNALAVPALSNGLSATLADNTYAASSAGGVESLSREAEA